MHPDKRRAGRAIRKMRRESRAIDWLAWSQVAIMAAVGLGEMAKAFARVQAVFAASDRAIAEYAAEVKRKTLDDAENGSLTNG